MFLQILNEHAPIKSKLLCTNHASYISKLLRKAIMKRSYLENPYFNKTHRPILKKLQKTKKTIAADYKKERNFFE